MNASIGEPDFAKIWLGGSNPGVRMAFLTLNQAQEPSFTRLKWAASHHGSKIVSLGLGPAN